MSSQELYREVDLLGYLPEYLHYYKELEVMAGVEKPELESLFNELRYVRGNQYILSCDLVGIERFEKLLGLKVKKSEDLESRRARVLVKWMEDIPYTYETLEMQLEALCGVDGFEMELFNDIYYLKVLVRLSSMSRFEEVQKLLARIVPCNLTLNAFIDFNKYKLVKPFMYKEVGKFTFKELREKEIVVDEYLHRHSEYVGCAYSGLSVVSYGVVRRKGEWYSE